jgi:hypothetical protein
MLGIPGMRVVRCFFAIECRSWTSGDARLTLNVTRIGIIYRSALFTHRGSMVVVGRFDSLRLSPFHDHLLMCASPGCIE